MQYPIVLDSLSKDDCGQPLVCSGCAHSAASAPFPGHPSGERPCLFCVRNVQREAWRAEHLKDCTGLVKIKGQLEEVACLHPAHGYWYGASKAIKVPMDCYHSCDMKRQQHIWNGGKEGDILIG